MFMPEWNPASLTSMIPVKERRRAWWKRSRVLAVKSPQPPLLISALQVERKAYAESRDLIGVHNTYRGIVNFR